MGKTFGNEFKRILILDIAAAGILMLHCLAFTIIASQGEYLRDLARKMLPNYIVLVLLWGVLEVLVLLGRVNHFHTTGTLSDEQKYRWMMVANICLPLMLLKKQGDIWGFMAIAIEHVSVLKTLFFIVTLVVPIGLMITAIIISAIAFFKTRKESIQ